MIRARGRRQGPIGGQAVVLMQFAPRCLLSLRVILVISFIVSIAWNRREFNPLARAALTRPPDRRLEFDLARFAGLR